MKIKAGMKLAGLEVLASDNAGSRFQVRFDCCGSVGFLGRAAINKRIKKKSALCLSCTRLAVPTARDLEAQDQPKARAKRKIRKSRVTALEAMRAWESLSFGVAK